MQQFRNTNNSAITLDGNYYEVNNGSGTGQVIRFNNAPSGQDDSILVVSNGLLAYNPDGSALQQIEVLAGKIDAMVPTLADLAGVPETNFQAIPSNVDLKSFGDTVLAILNVSVKQYNSLGFLTTTGSWTTNTNYSGSYWQDGEFLVGYVLLSLDGAPTAVTLTLNLPNGYTIDTSKIPNAGATSRIIEGSFQIFDNDGAGSGRLLGSLVVASSTQIGFRVMDDAQASSHYQIGVDATNPITFANNDRVQIYYKVPITQFGTGKKTIKELAGL
jgi:hypothetical protein